MRTSTASDTVEHPPALEFYRSEALCLGHQMAGIKVRPQCCLEAMIMLEYTIRRNVDGLDEFSDMTILRGHSYRRLPDLCAEILTQEE